MRTPRHSLAPRRPVRRSRPARPGGRAPAFSLLEIIIVMVILGVLAALVVPQFSNASTVARENSLRDELHYLRTQILVYRAQHAGAAPGYPDGDTSAEPTYGALVAQLTRYSDAAGRTSASPSEAFRYGPYLARIPENPLTGSAEVRFVAPGGAFPAAASGTAAWVYQPSTGALKANAPGADAQGVPYFDY